MRSPLASAPIRTNWDQLVIMNEQISKTSSHIRCRMSPSCSSRIHGSRANLIIQLDSSPRSSPGLRRSLTIILLGLIDGWHSGEPLFPAKTSCHH
ncbi:hypothetical protein NPIL_118601 [Nephila pilipes]|uniref:Uncharacterized protein n=1 Tax=Nephila pilipes TaxID=299642 RepID=A0A8X6NAC5_NEPPI|nr:hypothetical protein NPIL_118601 [Nephila pilipes]